MDKVVLVYRAGLFSSGWAVDAMDGKIAPSGWGTGGAESPVFAYRLPRAL